ncbi:glutaredoxin family protein [Oceanimonas baumannii]|uniref:Glutaredoxin n=1 Tax=Oceanimonas baumannii TaxID=129578 RepID=A0A235C9U5_9GAMM|nr:glutaredoxin [Oceanimonas baumannii]OYD21262.1 glutaredoxin [Oceanimonas baumannii]TDW55356.1 glutaredoxin [Oceanimonas baumannii]
MSLFDWLGGGASKAAEAAPAVASPDKLALYRKEWCPYCQRITAVVDELGLELTEYDTNDPEHLQTLIAGGGQRMVPCLRIEQNNGDFFWLYESADIAAYLRLHFGKDS